MASPTLSINYDSNVGQIPTFYHKLPQIFFQNQLRKPKMGTKKEELSTNKLHIRVFLIITCQDRSRRVNFISGYRIKKIYTDLPYI
ncbi:MAG: hypothetical protein EA409_05385 [Saprospirales bacterium]|nr:MAG: hypothetical protein EA409_05385 [Saprospirales bacterium]